MYVYIVKVTLRIALIASIIVYANFAWQSHQNYLNDYKKSQEFKRVFGCLSTIPEERLRSAENSHGNFDARKFQCTNRSEPFWARISEVRSHKHLTEPPVYWTKSSYYLEIIPIIAFSVIIGGTILSFFLWVTCWTFGLSSNKSNLKFQLNTWISAIVTGTLSAVVAGVILANIL